MKLLVIGAEHIIPNLSITPYLRKWSKEADDHIDIIISSNHVPLFSTNPDVKGLFILASPSGYGWVSGLIRAIRQYKKMLNIRKHRFDCIISLESVNYFQIVVWRLFSGVNRIVYFSDDEFVDVCLKKTINKPLSLPAVTHQQCDGVLKLYPDLLRVTELVRQYCIPLKSLTFGIIINSASALNWQPSEWARLIREIAKQGRVFLITAADQLVAGSPDTLLLPRIETLCSDVLVTPVFLDHLADFIAMVSLCSYLISADDDAAWIASALRVPVIYPTTAISHYVPRECTIIENPNVAEILQAIASHAIHNS